MAASALNLSRFLLMLRSTKRWWIPMTLLTIVGVNVAGLFLPRKYEAQAIVLIRDTKTQFISNVSNDVLMIEDRLKSIREEITSPDFLRTVAAVTNLDSGIPPDTQRYQKLMQKMAASIDLRVKEQAHFSIAYRAETPQFAYEVTRNLVDQFIKYSDNYYRDKAKKLESLIQTELNQATSELKNAQQAVIEFETQHFNEIPDSQERHLKRLSDLTLEKQTQTISLKALQERLDLARKRIEKMDPSIPTSPAGMGVEGPAVALMKLMEDRKKLEMNLNLLQRDFTTSHPQVIDTRAQLAEIDKLINDAQGKLGKDKPSQVVNREYADLQSQISAYEIEERRLQTGIAEVDRQVLELNGYLSNIPKNKGPLDMLRNDRLLREERVTRLTKQLDEAKIAGSIEQKGLGPSFEITSYPRLPLMPASPDRVKIGVVSVGLGMMAGMGLIYLFTVFDTVVRSVEEARVILRMPVLGVVQRIITAQEDAVLRRRRRRRLLGIGTSLALICTALTVGLVFYRDWLEHSLATVRNIINQW